MTAIDLADSLADFDNEPPIHPRPSVILANLVWMYHMGLVTPAALTAAPDGIPRNGLWNVIWTMTEHALDHRSFRPRCYACRVRERYLASFEVLG